MLALFRLEPTGGRADNLRFGVIATVLCKLKGRKNVTVDQFFPDGPPGEPKRSRSLRKRVTQHWTVMKAKFDEAFAFMGFKKG